MFGSLEAAQSVRRANTLIMQQCFVILKAERITHNILGLHTTLVGSVDSGIIMFSNLSCVVFCASHIMTAEVSNTY